MSALWPASTLLHAPSAASPGQPRCCDPGLLTCLPVVADPDFGGSLGSGPNPTWLPTSPDLCAGGQLQASTCILVGLAPHNDC